MGSSHSKTKPAVRTKWIQISRITQKNYPDVTQSVSFQRMPPDVRCFHPHNKQPFAGKAREKESRGHLVAITPKYVSIQRQALFATVHTVCGSRRGEESDRRPRPQRVNLLYSFQTVTFVLFLDFLVFLAEIPALRPAGSDSVTAMLIVASSLASAGVAASKCSAAPSSINTSERGGQKEGDYSSQRPRLGSRSASRYSPSPPGVEKRRESGWR